MLTFNVFNNEPDVRPFSILRSRCFSSWPSVCVTIWKAS